MSDPPENSVIFDSLPYVEETHPDYEEYALSLIEEEMKEFTPRPLPTPLKPINFRTDLMKNEYEARVSNGEHTPRPETSFQPLKIARASTLEEWRTVAIPQMKARFEAERIRSIVLEVEKEEAVPKWKDYVTFLEQMLEQARLDHKQMRDKVEEINFQRQQSQQQMGPQLKQLEDEYQQAVYRRNQLEYSIGEMRRTMAAGDEKGE